MSNKNEHGEKLYTIKDIAEGYRVETGKDVSLSTVRRWFNDYIGIKPYTLEETRDEIKKDNNIKRKKSKKLFPHKLYKEVLEYQLSKQNIKYNSDEINKKRLLAQEEERAKSAEYYDYRENRIRDLEMSIIAEARKKYTEDKLLPFEYLQRGIFDEISPDVSKLLHLYYEKDKEEEAWRKEHLHIQKAFEETSLRMMVEKLFEESFFRLDEKKLKEDLVLVEQIQEVNLGPEELIALEVLEAIERLKDKNNYISYID